MKINVTNFLGCKSASIENDKLTVITGLNHQGKSSILKGLAITVSQDLPKTINKKNLQNLVYNGQGTSTIKIQDDDTDILATFPDFQIKGINNLKASLIALGIDDFITLKEQDKVELIRRLLSCNPKKDDLLYALRNTELKKYPIDTLWNILKLNGWQASNEMFQNELKLLKREWSNLTKENFGSKKCHTWLPFGFDESLRYLDTFELEEQLKKLNLELEQAIANQAVSASEIERLQDSAKNQDQLKERLNAISNSIENTKNQIQEYDMVLSNLPEIQTPLLCPHCSGHVLIASNQIIKANDISEDDRIKILNDKEYYRVAKASAAANLTALQKNYNETSMLLNQSKKAIDDLAMVQNKNTPIETVNALREQYNELKATYNARLLLQKVEELLEPIIELQDICTALDEKGIRKDAMIRGLARFNELLANQCNTIGVQLIQVDQNINLTMSNRALFFLSESEKFCIKLVLQIVFAELDGSNTIIIDGFEILSLQYQQAFINELLKKPFKTFIGAMQSDIHNASSYKTIGINNVYWIENGNCHKI